MSDSITENGKNFTLNVTSLVSDIRDIFMSRRRMSTFLTPWPKMKEDDQQDEIVAITNLAEQVVRKCVDIIADNGFETIYATLDDVSLKTGKATLKIANIDDVSVLMALGAHIGKSVRIVVADDSDFDQARHAMEADVDQPVLPAVEEAAEENKVEPADPNFAKAVDLVRKEGKCTTSFIQRKLTIGYNKAVKLVELLEAEGIVTKADAKGKRTVILEAKPADDDFPEGDALQDGADTSPAGAGGSDDASGDGGEEPSETPAGADGKPLAPKAEGYIAGLEIGDKPRNPFIEGTDDEKLWDEGYGSGQSDVTLIGAEGKKAFAAGQESDICKYKAGSDSRMIWLRGYDQAEADALKAEGDDFEKAADDNDNK